MGFGAGASSDDDSPSKGGAGRAFFAGGGFVVGRASSDESLSRMDLAFFFFAEAGAGAGAGAAAPAALRRRASAAARRFSSRRRLNSAPLRPFTTFGFSARSDSAVTIVLPLVKAAPKLCLGLGFAMGFGGGRASSSEEVDSTILVCAAQWPKLKSTSVSLS